MTEINRSPIIMHAPATTISVPEIQALRLRIVTRWQRPTTIPGPNIANVLRGAVGLTLRRLVCPVEWHDHPCAPCPLYSECAYGQVFSPSPPPDSQFLRRQQDLPRPFVLEPPGLVPDEPVTPEGITFRLMLFGRAMDWLPVLITTLDRLGTEGMGPQRVPFTIDRITACHPAGDEPLFEQGSRCVQLPERVITTSDLITTPWPIESTVAPESQQVRRRLLARMGIENSPLSGLMPQPGRPRLKIKFMTPLLLKSGSGIDSNGERIPATEVRERPEFGVIIRRLRDRLSSLCVFFGEPWVCPDFAAIGTLADEVKIVDSRTTWLTRQRQSTRTGHNHEISGLIGQTTYEFPNEETLNQLTPLLKIAELIHLGKTAPWGNGGLRCIRP